MQISIVRSVFIICPHTASRDDSSAVLRIFVAIILTGLFAFILEAVCAQNTAMFNIYHNLQYGEDIKLNSVAKYNRPV
jgi:hypothetical protein